MMYNRTLATAVTALLIVFSLFLGGINSVNRLYGSALDVFLNGAAGDGVSVSKDINKNRDDARNLITIAAKYLPSDNLALKTLSENVLIEKTQPSSLYSSNQAITDGAKAVYDELSSYTLTESDAKYRQKLFISIESRNRTMANDQYNTVAGRYNSTISRFPASAWAVLCGKSTMPMFR